MKLKKYVYSLVAVGLVLFLNGCSAKGPQFKKFVEPTDKQSNIYVYRTSYAGGAITPDIHLQDLSSNKDVVIGEIKPDGFIVKSVKPGKYLIWAKTEVKNEVALDVKKNKNYCIEHYLSFGFLVGRPQFKEVSMDQCEREIKNTKLSM